MQAWQVPAENFGGAPRWAVYDTGRPELDWIQPIILNIRYLRTMRATEMIRVSSTEFGKELGRYQDAALSQPVIVTRNGRDRTVVISAEEFQRLKRRDRQVFATADAPEEVIEAVRNSEMDPRHEHLDQLLKDWTP